MQLRGPKEPPQEQVKEKAEPVHPLEERPKEPKEDNQEPEEPGRPLPFTMYEAAALLRAVKITAGEGWAASANRLQAGAKGQDQSRIMTKLWEAMEEGLLSEMEGLMVRELVSEYDRAAKKQKWAAWRSAIFFGDRKLESEGHRKKTPATTPGSRG